MMLTPAEARALIQRSQADPAWWVRTVLHDTPWTHQVRVLESIRDNRETAVASCHGAGKSFIAARAALWFLATHRPSLVITTAPTDRQVRGILWKEIRKAYAGATPPLGGTLLTQELRFDDDWWAWGFTAPEYDPDRFQGFHEEYILVIVDEASGVSSAIYDGIDGILSSQHSRLLLIGNPTDPAGRFAQDFKTPGVSKIRISAFDTPNFTQFGITEDDLRDGTWEGKITGPLPCPKLVTPHWAAERYRRWRPGSVLYTSRVQGDFPAQSKDTLIPLAWIERAQQKNLPPGQPHRLGVDVARYGGDDFVIVDRQGGRVRVYAVYPKCDTMEGVGYVVRAMRETDAESANVDGDGLGAGVFDRLVEQGVAAMEMRAGFAAEDSEQFLNKRAEWWWGLRERFEQDTIDLDPDDEELASDLAEIRYKVNSRGQIQIESKEDMRKRIGRSPDKGDAVAMAFGEGEALPARVRVRSVGRQR